MFCRGGSGSPRVGARDVLERVAVPRVDAERRREGVVGAAEARDEGGEGPLAPHRCSTGERDKLADDRGVGGVRPAERDERLEVGPALRAHAEEVDVARAVPRPPRRRAVRRTGRELRERTLLPHCARKRSYGATVPASGRRSPSPAGARRWRSQSDASDRQGDRFHVRRRLRRVPRL